MSGDEGLHLAYCETCEKDTAHGTVGVPGRRGFVYHSQCIHCGTLGKIGYEIIISATGDITCPSNL